MFQKSEDSPKGVGQEGSSENGEVMVKFGKMKKGEKHDKKFDKKISRFFRLKGLS